MSKLSPLVLRRRDLMIKLRPTHKQVVDLKNQLRGHAVLGRSQGRKKLSEIREVVSSSQLSSILTWLKTSFAFDYRPLGSGIFRNYKDLAPEDALSSVSFKKELVWCTTLLEYNAELLSDFRHKAEIFSSAMLRGNGCVALEALDNIESTAGVSAWLIEARIACLQRYSGLEAQKSFATHINEVAPQSFAAFAAYYASERNEESFTFDRFDLKSRRLLEEWNIPSFLRDYLRFRLLGELPINLEGLAGVLRAAAAMSIVDLYETYIEIQHFLLRDPKVDASDLNLLSLVARLYTITDYRIDKLAVMLGSSQAIKRLQRVDISYDEWICAGDWVSVLQMTETAYEDSSFAHALQLLSILAIPHRDQEQVESDSTSEEQESLGKDIVNTLKRIYLKESDFEEAFDHLAKMSLNYHSLPIAAFLRAQQVREESKGLLPLQEIQNRTSMSYPGLHPLEALAVPKEFREKISDQCLSIYGTTALSVLSRILSLEEEYIDCDGVHPDVLRLSRMLIAFDQEQFTDCIDISRTFLKHTNRLVRIEAVRYLSWCYIKSGSIGDAIALMVSQALAEPGLMSALPFAEMFEGKRFRHLSGYKSQLSLSIALHMALMQRDSGEIRTVLRAAWDEFLRYHHFSRPSDIANNPDLFALDQIKYFLHEVSQVTVMDISSSITGTRALLQERLSICRELVRLSPSEVKSYQEEIILLSKSIKVEDGLQLFDRSRIHVDLERLLIWASRDLLSAFERYQALTVTAPILSEEELDKVLTDLLNGKNDVNEDYKVLPANEAEAILVDLVYTIAAEFLVNPLYGLDYFLSQRVRHGSLAGTLRSPLEERGLTSFRDKSTNTYQTNTIWLNKFDSMPEEQLKDLSAALMRFAKNYDSVVDHLNNEVMHIHCEAKPEGVFAIELDLTPIKYLRNLIHEGVSFDEFVTQCLYGLLRLLSPSLHKVRSILHDQTKINITEIFASLQNDVVLCLGNLPDNQLRDNISAAFTEAQRALDQVTDWFRDNYNNEVGLSFSLDEIVDVAVSAVQSTHGRPSIKLEKEIHVHHRVGSRTFFNLVDVLVNLFDNSLTHSTESGNCEVKLTAEEYNEGLVKLVIKNPVPSCFDFVSCNEKMEFIRSAYSSGSYKNKINKEGGSGLFKATRIVTGYEGGTIDYGPKDDGTFSVEIQLTLPAEMGLV